MLVENFISREGKQRKCEGKTGDVGSTAESEDDFDGYCNLEVKD